MNGKSLVMLLLAVVSGLGAMYGTTKLMSKDEAKTTVEMQDVLVAVRDLKIEEVLKPDMVKVVQMAKTNIPAGAFSSYQDVEDRWIQIKILDGEPIVDRKLAPKGSPAGLVSRIPKGMRAFAVEVNEHTGVSGFILPDHRVDVVQVDPNNNNKNNDGPPEAETILEDVLVLASGQVFTRPEDRSIQARTVTLAVTPAQVDILVAARSKGPLSLALRGLNDHMQVAHKPAAPKPVVVAAKPPEPTPAPPPPPTPAPPPAPTPERPKYVSIYHGPQNFKRVRLDDGAESNADFESETVGAAPGNPN